MIHSYSKVYNLGHKIILDILTGDVVVQEKIDGSQFSFGMFDGVLYARSKGQQIDLDAPDKLFKDAVQTVIELWVGARLIDGWTYRGEVLAKPKHNTLVYNRVPEGNIILFDIDMSQEYYMDPIALSLAAADLGLETVPTIMGLGSLTSLDILKEWLEQESCLGGTTLEGVVIKNYTKFTSHDSKVMMGKYVSEAFKESNKATHAKATQGDVVTAMVGQFKTTARWDKAIQHLRDDGCLADDPTDIGPLMAELAKDLLTEEGDAIREIMFKRVWKDIARGVSAGFPQYYKDLLAEHAFDPS